VVWMDGISIKIRHNGKVVNKTIYLVIGLTQDGMKQVLGMWISETESASFWMTVSNRSEGSWCKRYSDHQH
jgi:putative transposase